MMTIYSDPELNVSVLNFNGTFVPVYNTHEGQAFIAVDGKPQSFETAEEAITAVQSYGLVTIKDGEQYAKATSF